MGIYGIQACLWKPHIPIVLSAKQTSCTPQTKKREASKLLLGTRNRGRTGTGITAHRILSPACLPIPPSEPLSLSKKTGQMYDFIFILPNIIPRTWKLSVEHILSPNHKTQSHIRRNHNTTHLHSPNFLREGSICVLISGN